MEYRPGLKLIGCGVLMLIVGGIITGLTYAAASRHPEGGIYIVTRGLFFWGVINIIIGIVKWLIGIVKWPKG
ncbi:MAG: hypothetical protein HY673_18925 [Chloroflexi bacterium]|nr:hypothetical protein [Chloroflexota bacterium]